MKLTILSLKGIEYEGDITSLNIQTRAGEITVLDHHRPLISNLKKGIAVIKDVKEKETRVEIGGGFLEVDSTNRATVLAD